MLWKISLYYNHEVVTNSLILPFNSYGAKNYFLKLMSCFKIQFFFYIFLRIFICYILFFLDNSSFLPFKMSKQQLLRITGILEEEGGFFCIGIKDGGWKEGALYRQVSGTRHGYNITMERGGHFSPIPFCSWVLFTYFLDSSFFFFLTSPSSLYV